MVTKKATKKNKQGLAHPKFVQKYKSLTGGLDDFLFSDECPKYAFFPAA